MKIKIDCRYYKGDKPCFYHKEYKVKCTACKYYKQEGKRILLIKLAAVGDVLRTTSVPPAIKDNIKTHILFG